MKLSVFVIAVAVLAIGAIQAKDTTTFRVDSYIPQRFTDFRWSLSGQAGLNGSDDEYTRRYSLGYGLTNEWRSNNSDAQQLQLSSVMSYDFVTVPATYNYSLGLQIAGAHGKNSGTTSNTYIGRELNVSESRSTSHNWRFVLMPGAALTRYVVKDFYLRPSINANVAYSDMGNEFEIVNDYYDSLGRQDGSDWSDEKTTGYRWEGGARTQFEVGVGREYSARFAFLALSMIEQLRKGGFLVRPPEYIELNQLCDTILEYRQRHAIDKRYRRIAALSSILKLLRNDGIISSDDPTLAYVLADIWDYYPDRTRNFGYMAGTGCELNYAASYTQNKHEDRYSFGGIYRDTRSQSISSGRVILYERLEYLKPLSLRWHLVLNSRINYMANQYRVTEGIWTSGLDRDVWGHESGASVDYYYDARTSLRAGFVASKNSNVFQGADASTRQDLILVSSDVIYRLGVPTTIRANFSIQWYSIKSDDPVVNHQDNQRYNLGVSIEHWLY